MFVPVPVNGCKSSPVQSCLATRILHHAGNGFHLSSPFSSQTNQSEIEPLLFALSASISLPPLSGHSSGDSVPPPSRPALLVAVAARSVQPICQPPRLLARWGRIVLGALAFHHNQTTLSKPFYPKSHPYTSGIWPRMTPFRSLLIADHLSKMQRFPRRSCS